MKQATELETSKNFQTWQITLCLLLNWQSAWRKTSLMGNLESLSKLWEFCDAKSIITKFAGLKKGEPISVVFPRLIRQTQVTFYTRLFTALRHNVIDTVPSLFQSTASQSLAACVYTHANQEASHSKGSCTQAEVSASRATAHSHWLDFDSAQISTQ